ncbi:MAG: hypothetical protein V4662_17875 [Verrucomicrobiota bacterium]
MSEKRRFPRDLALSVFHELEPILAPVCEPGGPKEKPWMTVAGSLRRGRADVGDIEIVYAPTLGMVPDGLFSSPGNLFNHTLDELLERGVIAKRLTSTGKPMWGTQNKLATHVATGLPIDFFSTSVSLFFNYLVCRTGGKANNEQIATAAHLRGIAWRPYRGGFEVIDANLASTAFPEIAITSGKMLLARTEEDVFSLAGLPFLPPTQRL